ncbi:proline-rich Akt substrate 40 kDa isoform X2 [Amblyomma americanum]
MAGVRVCGCLNWSVHCQEVQACDLRHLAPAETRDRFFMAGVTCAKLSPLGITKRHAFLESVRTVGEWEVHSCLGCQRDVYAQGSSDGSLLLSAHLEGDADRIEALRASADYSPCFHILLPPLAGSQEGGAGSQGAEEVEEGVLVRLRVQQLAAQFLQQELEAMEARFRMYQEQQAQALERLRLRTARDRDALCQILLSSQHHSAPPSRPVAGVKARPVAHTGNPKRKPASRPQHDGEVFRLDGFDEDEAAFPSSEEEDSDDGVGGGGSSSSSALDEPAVRHCAYSLPVDMPGWRPRDDDHEGLWSFGMGFRSTSPHTTRYNTVFAVDHDRIGADIEALARSVCDGTEMFGDLPRPRLNSMQRPLF